MSSNTPEALSPEALSLPSSPQLEVRQRPQRFTRSISEIPPLPAGLHQGAGHRAGMQRNRTSVDVSAPEALSLRSSPGPSRRASVLMAGPGADGAFGGRLSGSRKGSDETGGDVERKNIAKTVTYALAPRESYDYLVC